VNGNRDGKNVDVKVKSGDLNSIVDLEHQSLENFQNTLEKIKGDQLNALLLVALYSAYYDRKELRKILKIDVKAIVTKAKSETASWWKKELERRKKLPAVSVKKVKTIK
jgi:hypothetical protein